MRATHILLIAIVAAVTLTRGEQRALAGDLPLDQMAVPRYDVWGPLPHEVKEELRRLVNEPQAEIDRLLASPDAREVGLGLFVLEQRADLDRLVTLIDLIDDPRPTIFYAEYLVATNQFIPRNQTVGEYLLHIYAAWFGLHPEEVRARREAIRAMNAWDRPAPWRQKVTRVGRVAMNRFKSEEADEVTLEEWAQVESEVKLEIRKTPSVLRWAVIVDARGHGFYSPEEARSELLLLDQCVRDQILTSDPLAAHAGEIGWKVEKDLVAKARALLQPAP